MDSLEIYVEEHLSSELKAVNKLSFVTDISVLTTHEKALIYKYSVDGYESMNESLRDNNGTITTAFGIHLLSTLKKLPAFAGLLYKGVNLNEAQLKQYEDAYISRQPVLIPAFQSASKSKLIASQFGQVLVLIYSRTGKDVEKLTKFGKGHPQNEKEVLFLPNCSFRVLEVTKEEGKTLITLEELI
jgi:hypothetical protein